MLCFLDLQTIITDLNYTSVYYNSTVHFTLCYFKSAPSQNSPFGQRCFQYEGNDLSNQSLQSYRFSAKKQGQFYHHD